ncbi:hypothetical protein Q4589_00410 [Cobetia marina]|uniref:hypothetical protein n=1 Tax=Cobetia marina TaxID=28258 RepID=UPI0026E445D7|nr:hypothetical protein [Cobetia marina]MDO6786042.1 hypothetical protein [Cobetia marina]
MDFIDSVVTGIVSGLISGWFIVNYSEFKSLRDEALDYVRRIDYMLEGDAVVFSLPSERRPLLLLSSAMIWNGYNGIADSVNEINKGLSSYLSKEYIDYSEFDDFLNNAQREIRRARPNFCGLVFGRNVDFMKDIKEFITSKVGG